MTKPVKSKKPSTSKPAPKKKAPTPKPVPVPPVEQPNEEPEKDIPALLTKTMVMQYYETFTGMILGMRGQILQTIINSLYEKGEEEASEEYKAAVQDVINEANIEKDIRVATYEIIEANSKPDSEIAKADPATYFLFKSIKEELKGYNDDECNIEVVEATPGSPVKFIVVKEAILMEIAAKDNILQAMGEDAVCGICLMLKEIPELIIGIFQAIIVSMVPSIISKDLEGVMEKYVEKFAPAIAGVAIRALSAINGYFVQDPQGLFTIIVGQDELYKYYFKNVINTTSPDKASLFEIHYAANSGSKSIEDAIKEA